jgi:glutaredoxin
MNVVFYTTHCPQCSILAKKLEQKNIQYTTVEDVAVMTAMGLTTVPVLTVDGGAPMNFKDSVQWINSLEA